VCKNEDWTERLALRSRHQIALALQAQSLGKPPHSMVVGLIAWGCWKWYLYETLAAEDLELV
jgi:hypothetical protein